MLQQGDNITVSVSSHVTINSDDAWIKVELSRKIQHYETEDEAYADLNASVQKRLIETIENTAKTIIGYEGNVS